ncbi:hypothetical protein FB45DRAFT_881028 [Roridomyces roridus]|uniref:CxC2-like cysteine cluster KDZ transposase-associated domain-containing protein n=1 Tax=Roridomyces roridus TaxID=1738132 RepID=A0AAD7F639_9AGAR|nr:hypothetical protein FB45DRAFT_881028 [Roridomyces roridus]
MTSLSLVNGWRAGPLLEVVLGSQVARLGVSARVTHNNIILGCSRTVEAGGVWIHGVGAAPDCLSQAPPGAGTFTIDAILGNSGNDPIITHIDRPSRNGRRAYQEEFLIEPPSPVKRQRLRLEAVAEAAQPQPLQQQWEPVDPGRYQFDLGWGEDEGTQQPRQPRVFKPSDAALHRFRDRRDEYLRVVMSRDGFMDDLCHVCRDPAIASSIRCQDCFGDEMLCEGCCVVRHATHPLHRIEKWNGEFFAKCQLSELGLRVQLGHHPGQRCAVPRPAHSNFWVLHTNGFHRVNLDICGCELAGVSGAPDIQMLQAGWFPATDDSPRTCVTFACLDLFLASTLQAKTTMYDFYSMLEKMTDHTGIKPPNRYAVFLRVCREYRHLLMLKRAGQGHEEGGVMATKPGGLAVLCPCCPRPGVNIPTDWENAPAESRFLYITFLAIDACFRLKRRLVSNEIKDAPLGPGWSYMVESAPYREFLRTATNQNEMSTCSGLAALDYANTKFSRGYSATGVGMGVCARHEFVQPTGVGDLQKGERYVNMDYIFASILRHLHAGLPKIISYDIVCQWWKNLAKRLKELPPLACQLAYSLNTVPGSAQTNGEGIERPWAHLGGVASSTREMGPGSREDVLNCHLGNWNWDKLVNLADRLRIRLDREMDEYETQSESFNNFSGQQAKRVPEWQRMIEEWEADPAGKKDPYEKTHRGITEKDVLLRLEKAEAERVKAGIPSVHTVSPCSFIAAGLEVEEEQMRRRVRLQIQRKKAGTTTQEISIVALRRKLTRTVGRLRVLQQTYTPASIMALNTRDAPEGEHVENEPLFLPSALSAEQRQQEPLNSLAVIEDSLRDAQCSTALDDLRRYLHVKSRVLTYKRHQARHQGANTRARAIVEQNEAKIRLHSEKYQDAWEAKRRLAGGDPARVGWSVLRAQDIRCMGDEEQSPKEREKKRRQTERRERQEDVLRELGELAPLTGEEQLERAMRGENVREISWIWTGTGTTGEPDMDNALRIEWSKAYARCRRWDEEIKLLREEQRRLPISLNHRADEWEARARSVPMGVLPVSQQAKGAIAYALKQAAMFRDLARRAEVTRTEVRLGRGKRRVPVISDDMDVDEAEDEGWEEDGEELDDCRGDVSDEEHILDGGLEDD